MATTIASTCINQHPGNTDCQKNSPPTKRTETSPQYRTSSAHSRVLLTLAFRATVMLNPQFM
jgi:hypothetical protein